MENTNNKVFNKVTVLIFVIGIVVGFGSASLWLRRSQNSSMGVKDDASSVSQAIEQEASEKGKESSLAQISASTSKTVDADSLAVNNQSAGNAVVLSSVALTHDAWVAVHEENNGKPGKILGAQLFPAGIHSGNVDLLRETTAGGNYYAMIHKSDGDHTFDAAKDMPVKDAEGNPVMVKFTATSGANVQ